jgi:hypothetical protein
MGMEFLPQAGDKYAKHGSIHTLDGRIINRPVSPSIHPSNSVTDDKVVGSCTANF